MPVHGMLSSVRTLPSTLHIQCRCCVCLHNTIGVKVRGSLGISPTCHTHGPCNKHFSANVHIHRHGPCIMGELSFRKNLCRYFQMKAVRQAYARAGEQYTVILSCSRILVHAHLCKCTFIIEVESQEWGTERVQTCNICIHLHETTFGQKYFTKKLVLFTFMILV